MLAEVFENQRFSPELKRRIGVGRAFLGISSRLTRGLGPTSSTLHQLASAVRTREEVTPPKGWEYLGEWQLDTTHTECEAEEGWSCGNDFAQRRRHRTHSAAPTVCVDTGTLVHSDIGPWRWHPCRAPPLRFM